MNKVFSVEYPILFSHCDPAGIAYFPHLFDLVHQAMEAWFNGALQERYSDFLMKKRLAAPTVGIQCDFLTPANFGDPLTIELVVTRLGGSSVDLEYHGRVGERACLKCTHTICIISLETRKAVPIPAGLRERMQAYVAEGSPKPA